MTSAHAQATDTPRPPPDPAHRPSTERGSPPSPGRPLPPPARSTPAAAASLGRGVQAVHDAQHCHRLHDNGREYLKRARRDFEQAQDLYSRIGSFSNAPANLIGAIRDINQVNNRLEEMDMVAR